MPNKLDIRVPFKGTAAPWFIDPAHRRMFSGTDYNAKCVAAIGPHDFARVTFVLTANPKHKVWTLGRTSDVPLIVHEAIWSRAQLTPRVLAELMQLLDRANVRPVDGWVTIPRTHLAPLLSLAAEKAGVPSWRHRDFEAHALGIETEKFRARLARTGLDPAIVAAHRYV